METFDPESITGLSEEDAAGKLEKEGYNELPSQKNQSLFSILLMFSGNRCSFYF